MTLGLSCWCWALTLQGPWQRMPILQRVGTDMSRQPGYHRAGFCTVPSGSVSEKVRALDVMSITSVCWGNCWSCPGLRGRYQKLRMPRGSGTGAALVLLPICVMILLCHSPQAGAPKAVKQTWLSGCSGPSSLGQDLPYQTN